MDKNKIYKTGQLSDILGLSRDALRYYQEKGIVNPKRKEENDYREFDLYDIYALMVTDFYKKRGLSVKEVKELQSGSEIDELKGLLNKKAKDMEEVIQNQINTLNKIKETAEFCSQIEKNLNQYSFRSLPLCEKIAEFSDFNAFNEYHTFLKNINLQEEDILSKVMRAVSFNETGYLNSKMYIVEKADDNHKKAGGTYLEFSKCIYTIIEDGRYNNEEDHIMEYLFKTGTKWAEEQGVKLKGTAFAQTRLILYSDNKERVFLEIYIPVS